ARAGPDRAAPAPHPPGRRPPKRPHPSAPAWAGNPHPPADTTTAGRPTHRPRPPSPAARQPLRWEGFKPPGWTTRAPGIRRHGSDLSKVDDHVPGGRRGPVERARGGLRGDVPGTLAPPDPQVADLAGP